MKSRGAAAAENTQPTNQPPSCGINRVCEPTGMRVERVLLFEGPREVEVIEECHCEIKLTQCMRVPALRTYYSETPYETVIDVGGCSGSKGSPGACGSGWRQPEQEIRSKNKTKQKSIPKYRENKKDGNGNQHPSCSGTVGSAAPLFTYLTQKVKGVAL